MKKVKIELVLSKFEHDMLYEVLNNAYHGYRNIDRFFMKNSLLKLRKKITESYLKEVYREEYKANFIEDTDTNKNLFTVE